jgi:hypothetical protein
MSFNVFAAGSSGFHYKKDGFVDADTFEPMKLVSELMTMEPSVAGAVGAAQGHYTPDMTNLMGTLAAMEFLHLLNDGVCMLAMCSGASDGWISVSSKKSHTLWPDTMGFARYNFQPGDDPGAEFIKAIGPSLKATDLNNWGVLAALSIVLSKYYDKVGDSGVPMLYINLDH